MEWIKYNHTNEWDDAGGYRMIYAFFTYRNKSFFRNDRQEIQSHERNKHNEHIEISAVDVTPEGCHRNNKPNEQYVSVRSKNKYQQKYCNQHIWKSCRPNIQKWTANKHRSAAKYRRQGRIDTQ